MKKTLKYVYMAVCGIFTLFILSGSGCAAPSFNTEAYRPQSAVNDAKQWPIAQQYQQEGEVWPPVAGRYERKNANGVTNAYINVTVLPDQWPVITLHACDYEGKDDAEGWEKLSQAPAVSLGGQIIGLAITDSPPAKKRSKALIPVQLRLGGDKVAQGVVDHGGVAVGGGVALIGLQHVGVAVDAQVGRTAAVEF